MKKPYSDANVPAWVHTASRERLIEQIFYLTHERDKAKRNYDKKLRENRKLKKELEEKTNE